MADFVTTRDADLSLWQSAVAAAEREQKKKTEIAPINLASPKVQATADFIEAADPTNPRPALSLAAAGGLPSDAELSAAYHAVARKGIGKSAAERNKLFGGLFKKYGTDPGLITSVIQYWEYYTLRGGKPVYNSWKEAGRGKLTYSVIDWKIPPRGTVALIGDWGTGQQEAIDVLRAACSYEPDAIIHLGDIYYSGTHAECDDHLLKPLRRYAVKKNGEPIPFFNLAGNHDYYSGGAGFHWLLTTANALDHSGATRQEASYFCLRSADAGWQFLAMDTGYNEHGISAGPEPGAYLRVDELEWLKDKLRNFVGRTILLSHHQFCSAQNEIGQPKHNGNRSYSPRLYAQLSDWFDKVDAWFWGHEHNVVIFDEFLGLKRGCCVGHSGIPVHKKFEGKFAGKYFSPELSQQGRWFTNGFEILKLNGAGAPIEAEYMQVISGVEPEGYLMNQIHWEEI